MSVRRAVGLAHAAALAGALVLAGCGSDSGRRTAGWDATAPAETTAAPPSRP